MANAQQAATYSFSSGVSVPMRLPKKGVSYSPQAFWDLCELNPELNFERNADGSVILMTLVGGEGSYLCGEVFGQLRDWAKSNGEGLSFESSGGFTLPSGAILSPDASWIRFVRWNALTKEQRVKFPPLAPDFVIEVRSESDKLPALRKKMREYIAQGVQLGWLIDPIAKSIEIYRPNQPPQRLENPKTLRAGPELPGFVLDLKTIWARKSH